LGYLLAHNLSTLLIKTDLNWLISYIQCVNAQYQTSVTQYPIAVWQPTLHDFCGP